MGELNAEENPVLKSGSQFSFTTIQRWGERDHAWAAGDTSSGGLVLQLVVNSLFQGFVDIVRQNVSAHAKLAMSDVISIAAHGRRFLRRARVRGESTGAGLKSRAGSSPPSSSDDIAFGVQQPVRDLAAQGDRVHRFVFAEAAQHHQVGAQRVAFRDRKSTRLN